jgi:hypothetical protein
LHVVRASADIVDEADIVVVGSQAILGSYPDAPASMRTSNEADVYPYRDPQRAIEISGAIGELSVFHDTNNYYAHAVGPETVIGPRGWEERLVRVRDPESKATGWCIEPHDLAAAKCAAGREHDWQFVAEAIRYGLVAPEILRQRLSALPLPSKRKTELRRAVSGYVKAAGIAQRNGLTPSQSPATTGATWVRAYPRNGRPVRGHWRGT